MTQHFEIAIVGGGIVGCSILYHLSKLGLTDVILIEKSDLASGSTGHAAGNVTFFGHYTSVTRLYIESVRTYLDAANESGIEISFHDSGSLRLATTEIEMDIYRSLESIYKALKVEFHIVGTSEINEVHPLLSTSGLLGAAYTPGDGHLDASAATRAMTRSARQRGGHVQCNSQVKGLCRLSDGNWQIRLEGSEIVAQNLVIATSFWARELLQPIGINIPVYALEHQEIITESIPEIEMLGAELPTVRDPVAPANLRQEGNGLLCGVYESQPKTWAVDQIPPCYQGELFPQDLGRLETHLERVIQRVPSFGKAGIKQVINGPICYTPDGLPLLGPVDSHPGLWLAAGFCVGVGTGGGAGAYLSRWIDRGEAPYHLPQVHTNRFTNKFTKKKALQSILNTYAMGYTLNNETK